MSPRLMTILGDITQTCNLRFTRNYLCVQSELVLTCKCFPDEPERPKTHCEHQREKAQTTSPEGYPILGAYVPQCDASGQYIPQQVSLA